MKPSYHMLQSCEKRCNEQGLDVLLYNQSLQTLHLQKKYALIFIAIGSFQLIQDRKEALHILKNLHSALLPGGRIALETFIPWDAIKDNIHGSILMDQSKEMSFERTAHSTDGSQVVHKSTVTVHFKEQIEKSQTLYEKWVQGVLTKTEEEDYAELPLNVRNVKVMIVTKSIALSSSLYPS